VPDTNKCPGRFDFELGLRPGVGWQAFIHDFDHRGRLRY
jgi:hypothetical protein